MTKTNRATGGANQNKSLLYLPVLLGVLAALLFSVFGAKLFVVIAVLFAGATLVLMRYEAITYVLCFYVLIDYVARNFIGGMLGSYWDELLLIAMLGIWVFKWLQNGKDRIVTTPLDGALILFYGASLFVLFANSLDFGQSVEGLRAAIQHTFWYFAVTQLIRSKENARNIYRLLVLVALLLGLHGVYQYIIGAEMPANWVDSMEAGLRTRVYSIIGSPNILASLMTLVAPMAFALFFAEEKPLNKLIYLGAAGVMCLCLVFTFSRGAWIGFMIAVGVYVLIKDKRLVVPAVLAMLVAAVAVPSVANRLTYMLSPEYIESSLRAGRLVRWIEGLDIVRTRPWLGMGHGSFGGAVAVNNEVSNVFYMDNYFLKTAVEMGIVGFVAFVILMGSVLIWAYRAAARIQNRYYRELCIGAFAGLTGVVAHNFVENVFEVPMMVTYFWTIAAVVMYLYRTLPLQKKQPPHAAENQ